MTADSLQDAEGSVSDDVRWISEISLNVTRE